MNLKVKQCTKGDKVQNQLLAEKTCEKKLFTFSAELPSFWRVFPLFWQLSKFFQFWLAIICFITMHFCILSKLPKNAQNVFSGDTVLIVLHISSVLHIWASCTKAFRRFCDSNNFFSKPVDLTTPSQRYPGAMPKRLGGGAGPLYLGYSGKIQHRDIVSNYFWRGSSTNTFMQWRRQWKSIWYVSVASQLMRLGSNLFMGKPSRLHAVICIRGYM